jgi:glycosyltransferase involved in cell wall biosynthesis
LANASPASAIPDAPPHRDRGDPCYNYGHYLPTALSSVLDQPGVEAIVIDDASPDGSGAIVRQLAAADERIRPIVHERNRGHIATYN